MSGIFGIVRNDTVVVVPVDTGLQVSFPSLGRSSMSLTLKLLDFITKLPSICPYTKEKIKL